MGDMPENRKDIKSFEYSFDKVTEDYQDSHRFETKISVLEESKQYSWARVYLKEEVDLEKGDVITVTYTLTSETLDLTFSTYNKKGSFKDKEENIKEYVGEDDKKVLCLLVDIKEINESEEIPFLRTLFKSSKWYEHQLLKRNDLKLVCKEKDIELDYSSIDF